MARTNLQTMYNVGKTNVVMGWIYGRKVRSPQETMLVLTSLSKVISPFWCR